MRWLDISSATWWRWIGSVLLAPAILLVVACAPGTTSTAHVPTATATLSADWITLEQRPLHLPTLAPGATCPMDTS